MNNSPSLHESPPCERLNGSQPGALQYNYRYVCRAHFDELSRPYAAPAPCPLPPAAPTGSSPRGRERHRQVHRKCSFPNCSKQGARAHGHEFYCKRHKTRVMELTAHVVGQALPVRERVNVHGNLVRLCQVGLCKKKGRTTVDEKLVCKDHAQLLREKGQFVDQSQPAFLVRRDYTRGKCASRSAMPVCNYVGCNRDKVAAKYRDFFCAGHLPVIDDLRGNIMAAKSDGDFEVQIPLRYNEIFLRKFLDEGHVHFYNSLVAKHGYVAPVVGIVGDQLVGVAGGHKTAGRLLN